MNVIAVIAYELLLQVNVIAIVDGREWLKYYVEIMISKHKR